MRIRLRPIAVVLAAASLVSGCATAPDVLGRDVILVPAAPRAPKPRGELLAVQDGRIWLRTKDDGVREMEAATFREVQVRRHDLGGGYARRIGLIGGLVSAITLTASCGSVEGNSAGGCAVVGAAVGGLLALTGVLTSMSLDASSRAHLSPNDLSLRAYARFPAGLPKNVPPASLTPGPQPRRP